MSDTFNQEYSIDMRYERVNTQIYRIFFMHIDRELLPYLEFLFEYKYLDHNLWKTIRSFDARSCRILNTNGDIFTYIRIPNKIFDYSIHIRLSLKILANAFGFESNKWMKHSNILTLHVISSLDSSGFKENDDQHPLADDYIDLCVMDRNYADFEILFRSNILNNEQNNHYFNVYCALIECGMEYASEYGDEFEDSYNGEISINAQSHCFAFNVMIMSFNTDYNLKLNCLKGCGSNLYTKDVNTVHKYRINNCLKQEWWFVCDICRCSVDEYEFMFHCDDIDPSTHHFCILCVYEMMQKHKYFTRLLNPLLLHNETLNNACIQVLISCIVGKVIKFE